MNSAGRSNISSIFQHGLQDGYLSLNPHVKGGLFPLRRELLSMRYACKLRQFSDHPTYAYVFSRHVLAVFENSSTM